MKEKKNLIRSLMKRVSLIILSFLLVLLFSVSTDSRAEKLQETIVSTAQKSASIPALSTASPNSEAPSGDIEKSTSSFAASLTSSVAASSSASSKVVPSSASGAVSSAASAAVSTSYSFAAAVPSASAASSKAASSKASASSGTASLSGSSSATPLPFTHPSRIMVGYYDGWAAYSGYTPDKINASGLTALNYAFA
jgi:cytoskeletal protein RodZ